MTVVDRMTVHILVIYGMAICVRYFELRVKINHENE